VFSRAELEALLERKPVEGSPVLSVYLDVDLSRPENLNRGFETSLANLLRSLERGIEGRREKEEFGQDAQRVRRFVAGYTPHGTGLAIFCDESAGLFWSRELHVPIRSDARWSPAPHIRPLLELLDEHDRYGVILTDRVRSRLFTVFLGEIEEHREAFAALDVHHTKTTGTDRIWSQSHLQRKADTHARGHLKTVADLMERLRDQHRFDRLVLAGAPEATSELEKLLSKPLRERLVAIVPLPVEASPAEVLRETRRLEVEAERREEERLVDELVTISTKNDRAVTGIEPTLRALREGRVRRLVYAEGMSLQGRRCRACSALHAGTENLCAYCGRPLEEVVSDLLEEMAATAVSAGAKVELVRAAAAERLRRVGGVGAYVRY